MMGSIVQIISQIDLLLDNIEVTFRYASRGNGREASWGCAGHMHMHAPSLSFLHWGSLNDFVLSCCCSVLELARS